MDQVQVTPYRNEDFLMDAARYAIAPTVSTVMTEFLRENQNDPLLADPGTPPESPSLNPMTMSDYRGRSANTLNLLGVEAKRDQLLALAWIENLSSQFKTDISDWDIKSLFAEKGFSLYTDRNELNKRFIDHLTTLKSQGVAKTFELVLKPSEQKELERIQKAHVLNRLENLRMSVDNDLNRIVERQSNISTYISAVVKNRSEMAALEGRPPLDYVSQVKDVVADGFWEFHKALNGTVEFITRAPIVLTSLNPNSKVALRVNMGKFKVQYYLGEGIIYVQKHSSNVLSGSYYHPYVSSSGAPCFGNANDVICTALTKGEIRRVMRLLSAWISTYSYLSGPYRILEIFQTASGQPAPKWEGGLTEVEENKQNSNFKLAMSLEDAKRDGTDQPAEDESEEVSEDSEDEESESEDSEDDSRDDERSCSSCSRKESQCNCDSPEF